MHTQKKLPDDERADGANRTARSSPGPGPDLAAGPLTPDTAIALQRSVGNLAVSRRMARDEHVHGAGCGHVDPNEQVELVEAARRTAGQPLDTSTQKELSSFYGGFDYSSTRLHTDAVAQRAVEALDATAFTIGQDIFAKGPLDKQTLAHEGGHVIQQSEGEVAGTDNGGGMKVSDPNHREETSQVTNGAAFAAGVAEAPIPIQRATASGSASAGGTPSAQRSTIQRAGKGKGKGRGKEPTYDEYAALRAGQTPAGLTGESAAEGAEGDYGYTPEQIAEMQYYAQGGPTPEQGSDRTASPHSEHSEESHHSGGSGQSGSSQASLQEMLNGMAPDYWRRLEWQKEKSGVYWAWLKPDDPVFHAIQAIADESPSYTAPAGENTRMNAVRERLDSTTAHYTDQQRATMDHRTHEGAEGGPPPPAFSGMRIEGVRVYANQELLNRYLGADAMERASRLEHHGDGTAHYGGHPGAGTPFASPYQPLGGTAEMTPGPGLTDMMQGLQVADSRGPTNWAPLFHGTYNEAAEAIMTGSDGLHPKYSRDKRAPGGTTPRYGPSGQAVYQAKYPNKSDTYVFCEECQDYGCEIPEHAPRQVLMNRTLLGGVDTAHAWQTSGRRREDHTRHHKDSKKERHDKDRSTITYSPALTGKSTWWRLGATGGDEFATKDAAYIYPEFRIYYRPKKKKKEDDKHHRRRRH